MRCLTSVSICPSLIRLLYLSPMSFFVGLTHEVPCDFERMAGLSVFSGRCNLCLRRSCQPSDRHADVNNPPQKPEVACLCVHVNRAWLQKAGTCPVFWHMPHPGWLLPPVSLFPRSLHNPPGGKAFRVFAVIWVHQRASSSNRTSNTRAVE